MFTVQLYFYKDGYSGGELSTVPTGRYRTGEVSLSKVATTLANQPPVMQGTQRVTDTILCNEKLNQENTNHILCEILSLFVMFYC